MIAVTREGGANGLISGLFLDAPASKPATPSVAAAGQSVAVQGGAKAVAATASPANVSPTGGRQLVSSSSEFGLGGAGQSGQISTSSLAMGALPTSDTTASSGGQADPLPSNSGKVVIKLSKRTGTLPTISGVFHNPA